MASAEQTRLMGKIDSLEVLIDSGVTFINPPQQPWFLLYSSLTGIHAVGDGQGWVSEDRFSHGDTEGQNNSWTSRTACRRTGCMYRCLFVQQIIMNKPFASVSSFHPLVIPALCLYYCFITWLYLWFHTAPHPVHAALCCARGADKRNGVTTCSGTHTLRHDDSFIISFDLVSSFSRRIHCHVFVLAQREGELRNALLAIEASRASELRETHTQWSNRLSRKVLILLSDVLSVCSLCQIAICLH